MKDGWSLVVQTAPLELHCKKRIAAFYWTTEVDGDLFENVKKQQKT